jgi:DNA replication protein DnaC
MLRDTYQAQQYGKPHRTEEQIHREMFEPDVLVLDDLGADTATDWTRSQVGRVVYRREREGLRTIVTTNLPMEGSGRQSGLRETYGRRTHSRLQSFLRIELPMKAPDLRVAERTRRERSFHDEPNFRGGNQEGRRASP